MLPGVSESESTGMSKASQSCRNRAALSEASESIAPPRCIGLLANTPMGRPMGVIMARPNFGRSEEHTSELQSLMRLSYAVLCLKKKKHKINSNRKTDTN